MQTFLRIIENAPGLEATHIGVWETPTRRFPMFAQNRIDDFPIYLNIGLTFPLLLLMPDRRVPYLL